MSSGSPGSQHGPTSYLQTSASEEAVGPQPGAGRAVGGGHTLDRARVAPVVHGLIAEVVEATEAERSRGLPLDAFLTEADPLKALAWWLSNSGAGQLPKDAAQTARRLQRDISQLDALISEQVNVILHAPAFQKLEASWRGLQYLVSQADGADNVKVRVLSVSWRELARDAERAIEFDQSQLFRKIYGEEFDTPGGEPFGMLLGDYEIHPRPGPDHPFDDVSILQSISQTAAAAFCPFVSAAHPSFFGLDQFSGLEAPLNLSKSFEQVEYLKWRAFRDQEDSRFIGLTAPRVLMRLPYEDQGPRVDGFRFEEDVTAPDRSGYLWGNAAYAFASVAVRAFSSTGWLADLRGVHRDTENGRVVDDGGLVTNLPVQSFGTDAPGVELKCSTDVIVTDHQEKELSDLGFIPLCHCKDTEFSAFYGTQSIQRPKKYDTLPATMNARMSSMLHYMLCVSRFAHYVKAMMRDKTGSFLEAADIEKRLHNWLHKYVTSDAEASLDAKARYPLRQAQVQVREIPGKSGCYNCVMHFWPHFQLDELTAAIRMRTELAG